MVPASSKSLWQKVLTALELDDETMARRRLQSGSSPIEMVEVQTDPLVIEQRRANRLRAALILVVFAVTMPLWLPGLLSGLFVIWVFLQ